MFQTYFKMARRQLGRNKVYSAINISGLALGMATCLLIYLWVQNELAYDNYHENADDIYRVVENQYYAGSEVFPVAVTPGPLAKELLETYPAIINSARTTRPRSAVVEVDERSYNESDILMASPSFLEIFSFPLAQGDASTALDEPLSVILSRSQAEKYFGSQEPMGRIIRLNQQDDFKVTGIIEDIPATSHLNFNMIIPFLTMKTMGANLDTWQSNSYFTYVQLEPAAAYMEVSDIIAGAIEEQTGSATTQIFLQPLADIHLHSDFTADVAGHGSYQYILLFSVIALIILLIACINFINLSTARSANRAREVGIRKVVGARRGQLGFQFIGESVFLAFLGLGLALFVVILLLPSFNILAAKNLALNQLTASQFALVGLAALITGLIAGSYPAFFLSAFHPVQVLRGSLAAGAGSALFRKVLVVVQFSLATSLIIGAVVVNRQLNFISEKKLGYDKENLIYITMGSSVRPKFETLKNEWEKSSGVLSVTHTSDLPTGIGSSTSGFDWEGRNPDEKILIHFTRVDYNYVETLGIEMAAGRFYSPEYPSDTSQSIIINEEAARLIGFTEPIGKQLKSGDDAMNIIGVVKDFHFKSVHKTIEPLALVLSERSARRAILRVSSQDLASTIASIEDGWKKVASGLPFEYRFIDEAFDRLYRTEQRTGSLFQYFSFIAILISCMGLFGLSSFITEQRTKEIGVRKVLGASVSGITVQLIRDFSRWVVVANLLAWPIGWLVMNRWLEDFAYRIDLSINPFLVAGLGTLMLAIVTVGYHSVTAALVNPAQSLRSE